MSVVFVCDRGGCGAGSLGTFDGHGWRPPAGWRSLILDDWEVHGCSEECFQVALGDATGATPASATRAWAKVRGISFAGPSPLPNLEVPQERPPPPPS